MPSSRSNSPEEQSLLSQTGTAVPPEISESSLEIVKEVLVNSYRSTAAIIVQIGLLGVVLSIYIQLFKQNVMLFTGHPFFNSLGLVLLGQGIIVVQPEPLSDRHKSIGGAIHGIFNTASTLFFITGTSFIWVNKHIHGAAHITTWHSTFGIFTVTYMFTVMLFGTAVYWFPNRIFGSVARAKSFYKYHRLAGFLAFSLILFTIGLALESDFNHNALHIKYTTLGLSLVITFVGVVKQLTPFKYGF